MPHGKPLKYMLRYEKKPSGNFACCMVDIDDR